MEIRLFINRNHYKKVDKRGSLSSVATLDCNLVEGCSVTEPVLVIAKEDIANIATCNYMYIPAFSRYYFCKLTALPGGMIQVTGKVDALTSQANQILGLRCQISRNEFDYNMDLPDPDIPVMVKRNLTYRNFNRTPFSTNPQGRHFALTVSGTN